MDSGSTQWAYIQYSLFFIQHSWWKKCLLPLACSLIALSFLCTTSSDFTELTKALSRPAFLACLAPAHKWWWLTLQPMVITHPTPTSCDYSSSPCSPALMAHPPPAHLAWLPAAHPRCHIQQTLCTPASAQQSPATTEVSLPWSWRHGTHTATPGSDPPGRSPCWSGHRRWGEAVPCAGGHWWGRTPGPESP